MRYNCNCDVNVHVTESSLVYHYNCECLVQLIVFIYCFMDLPPKFHLKFKMALTKRARVKYPFLTITKTSSPNVWLRANSPFIRYIYRTNISINNTL